jgi:hypothetical protein
LARGTSNSVQENVMAPPQEWEKFATPMVTRSRFVLEVASELVTIPDQPYNQAKVLMRVQGGPDWPLCLFGSSTIEGLDAVVKGEAALAIINPASALALAYRGKGIFKTPHPVRVICVIPSEDSYAFAVKKETGLTTFEEIGQRRVPLKVALRGQRDHWLHYSLDDIAAAAGFALDDIKSWGGELRREGFLPYPDGPKFAALARGEFDAIFDEAAHVWVDSAVAAGMTILPLAESTVRTLEAMGYQRSMLTRDRFPSLTRDLLTIDFSGWPVFVREDAPDLLVTRICAAIVARKHLIPWQGEGPLPIERMCRDLPDNPQLVPFHPAAERFWKANGFL